MLVPFFYIATASRVAQSYIISNISITISYLQLLRCRDVPCQKSIHRVERAVPGEIVVAGLRVEPTFLRLRRCGVKRPPEMDRDDRVALAVHYQYRCCDLSEL